MRRLHLLLQRTRCSLRRTLYVSVCEFSAGIQRTLWRFSVAHLHQASSCPQLGAGGSGARPQLALRLRPPRGGGGSHAAAGRLHGPAAAAANRPASRVCLRRHPDEAVGADCQRVLAWTRQP